MTFPIVARVLVGTAVAISLCMSIAISHAQPGNLAGRVTMTVGQVTGKEENVNSARTLFRRSAIYAVDTITTDSDAIAHFRMVDGAVISMTCDTSFKIEDYWYEDNPVDDRVTLRLLSGRIRMISGSIPETNREAFRFLVGDAQVSIRGTDFEVVTDPIDQTLYISVFDGGITVTNQLGSVRLGIDGTQRFGVVRPGEAPEGLMVQSRRNSGC